MVLFYTCFLNCQALPNRDQIGVVDDDVRQIQLFFLTIPAHFECDHVEKFPFPISLERCGGDFSHNAGELVFDFLVPNEKWYIHIVS
jgi:hypothetical protein